LGVRLALGASRSSVLAMVLRQGSVLAAGGLLAGGLVIALCVRLLSGLLFRVRPVDPLSFAAAALVLLAVALGASLVPALRAMRIDLMDCFRSE